MAAKKISFSTKPNGEKPSVNEWVSNRETSIQEQEAQQMVKMKRLTLDIPESLHRAIKMKAVEDGVAMADLLRSLLEQHYG
jgi:predicted DNA binding CopG/RHH family protein